VAGFSRAARAEQDLIEIWTYVATDSPIAADRLLDRIDAVCRRLAENPRMGAARPDLAPQLRHFVTGPYLILYREAGAGVEIVRVLHGARDLPGLLDES
jgi:toxin ParE1/3/4